MAKEEKREARIIVIESVLSKSKSISGKPERGSRFLPFPLEGDCETYDALKVAFSNWLDDLQAFDKAKGIAHGQGIDAKTGELVTRGFKNRETVRAFGIDKPCTPQRVRAAILRGFSLAHQPEMNAALLAAKGKPEEQSDAAPRAQKAIDESSSI